MTMVIQDRHMAQIYIRERRASGNDRWDEVWDGTYLLMPNPNVEHQDIATGLASIFRATLDWQHRGKTYQGVNVSDQPDDWTHNYRCPDVAVYLPDNPAKLRGSYWLGGPDFVVEIISPDDRSRQKFDFYAKVGVRELLLVDRDPWALELYQRRGTEWKLAGTSKPEQSDSLTSEVLLLTFRLVPSSARPIIEVIHADGNQKWTV